MGHTKDKVTIYITKYALTDGIQQADAEVLDSGRYWYIPKGGSYPTSVGGNDAHLTKDAALDRAEEMRIAKLQSLEKQMKKISAMKFKVK